MKVIEKSANIFDRTLDYLAYLAGILLVLIVIFIGIEVMSRLLVNRSQVWVVEFSENFLVYITFLATAWLLAKEGHVRMDLVLGKLSPGAQALLNTVTSVVGAILCIVVARYGVEVAWDMFQRGVTRQTMLETPVAPLITMIFIGHFLLFVQFLRLAYRYSKTWRELRRQE